MAIEILSSEVVDQIAAGEVVERPSHMVKELVENSLDAGATEIEVEFDQGGRTLVVMDNGSGIPKDELSLALARHATSKIRQSVDLWSLNSFGFRGEALASIAAVSDFEISSRTLGAESAYKLKCEFGKTAKPQETGGSQGTTIRISKLFENIPARLKFLKSEAAEGTQIKNTLRALSMAYPQVGFRVRNKGKLLFFWPPAKDRIERVLQVMDREQMYPGAGECDGIRAQVLLCSPNEVAKNSRQVWIFAQNRWVQDRSLQAAVFDAYRGLLMHGEYPIAVIWVECDPEDIDINIHPTKSQVKFRQPSSAYRAVSRAARSCLEAAPWLESLIPASGARASLKNGDQPSYQTSFSTSGVEGMKTTRFNQRSFTSPPKEGVSIETLQKAAQGREQLLNPSEPSSEREVVAAPDGGSESAALQPQSDYNCSGHNDKVSDSSHWSKLQVLGQAHLTYIVAQSEKAVVFVDQHAAHERVVYERLMAAWKGGQFEVQPFLLPETIHFESEEELLAVAGQQEELAKAGIDIDITGPVTISVRSAPSMINFKGLQKSLLQLADEIVEKSGSFAIEKRMGDLFATMACHSVVRAGQPMSSQEMMSLLRQMDEFPLSSFCPHGRPVFVEYPINKLERDFGRTV